VPGAGFARRPGHTVNAAARHRARETGARGTGRAWRPRGTGRARRGREVFEVIVRQHAGDVTTVSGPADPRCVRHWWQFARRTDPRSF